MKRYNVTLRFDVVQEDLFAEPELHRARDARDVSAYMAGAFSERPEQEQFWVLMLDARNHVKGRQLVTVGTQTATLAHPREVFRAAILCGATSIICCHNHPSGDPSPSAADMQMTRQLREAGKAVDIPMQDHVILGAAARDPLGRGFYSFREGGQL